MNDYHNCFLAIVAGIVLAIAVVAGLLQLCAVIVHALLAVVGE